MAQHTIETDNFWDGAEVISRYTRADALRDGVLVDITATAWEAGVRFPVAMTCGLHAEAVAWNQDNRAYQDESGRLWDVLTMATYAMRSTRGSDRATATVARIPNTPRPRRRGSLTTPFTSAPMRQESRSSRSCSPARTEHPAPGPRARAGPSPPTSSPPREEPDMTTTTDTAAETTDRRLSDEQCEQLAEWLVASNGEGCDLLDCYAVELEAGLDVVLDLDPDVPTRADEQRVTGSGEQGDRDRLSWRTTWTPLPQGRGY